MADWDISDWFGFIGVLALIIASCFGAWSAWFTTVRAGRQRVADARLKWGDQYHDLSLDLHENLLRLERYHERRRTTVISRRLEVEAKRQAVSLLMMVNPDTAGKSANDEQAMENFLVRRLLGVGIDIDMTWVRAHRPVVKNNWRRAKGEF